MADASSLFSPRLRKQLQQAAQIGAFTAIWSPWIIAELNRILSWDWMRKHGTTRVSENACSTSAKIMMEWLISSFEVVDPRPPYPPVWEDFPDRWDHSIWAAAKAGNAGYIVSENTRHFPPRQADGHALHEGVRYLTGDDFIGTLIEGMSD